MLRPFLATLLALTLLSHSACRKRTNPPTPPPAEAPAIATEPAAGPAPTAPAAPAAPNAAPTTLPPGTALAQAQPGSSETGTVNGPLSGAVARFMDKHKRLPANWQELVQTGFIKSIPTPPPGKKFAVDPVSYVVVEVN